MELFLIDADRRWAVVGAIILVIVADSILGLIFYRRENRRQQPVDSSHAKMIQVTGLSAVLGGRQVLQEVSFTVYANEITVIIGGSGCGKTTVLKHLIGLYPVQEGRVVVRGEALTSLEEPDKQQLALRMGVLFQNGALLNSLTAAENVAVPLEQHTDLPEAIVQALVRLKLRLVELEQAGRYLAFNQLQFVGDALHHFGFSQDLNDFLPRAGPHQEFP